MEVRCAKQRVVTVDSLQTSQKNVEILGGALKNQKTTLSGDPDRAVATRSRWTERGPSHRPRSCLDQPGC